MAAPDLRHLDARLDGLLAAVAPSGRSQLARLIARALRQSTGRRIAAQLNPDGTPFEPRKPRLRRKKGELRRTLFAKLRTARYLKAESNADAAIVTFAPSAQRIARVHQEGLRDRVVRQIAASAVKYPERHLLGLTTADRETTAGLTLDHLAK